MKIGKNPKLNPNDPEFDYDEWRKSQGIKPAIEISIEVKKENEGEDDESEMEDSEENDEEPEEYVNFKKENGIKSIKDVLSKSKRI